MEGAPLTQPDVSICLLCGGVGGARAALALAENLPPQSLTFVVNTGDDFTHLGLEVWPDWDTLLYTLSGTGDAARGWGRADEGTKAMEEFTRLGAPDWFHLGDRDLALHVVRTWQLAQASPDAVARDLLERFGLSIPMLRATRQSLATKLRLQDGSLMDFQTWFVGHQGRPKVVAVEVPGAAEAQMTDGVLTAIRDCDLLLFAPSNPYLSLFPMLEVPQLAEAVKARTRATWTVSPLLDGKAVKGPLDALIAELSPHTGQRAVLQWYTPWTDRLLLPAGEAEALSSDSVVISGCRTRLGSPEQRAEFAADLWRLWKERSV